MATIEAGGQLEARADAPSIGSEPVDGPLIANGALTAAGVARLLRELREQDRLRIGLDREIRCRTLVLRLASVGIRLDRADVAADWLAPLVANSLPDQTAVRLRLDRYFRAGATQVSVPSKSDESAGPAIAGDVPQQVQLARKLMLWVLLIGGGSLAAVLGVAWSGRPRGGGFLQGTATGAQPVFRSVEIMPELAFGLLIGLGVYVALTALRRELNRLVVPGPAEGAPRLSMIGIRQLGLFDSGVLRPALRALRDFRQPIGRLVDVAASIRLSVREGGIPHLVFGNRPKLPDYLILAEQYGIADQFRLLQASPIARLDEARVHFEPLTFGASPLVLRRWSQPRARPERLDQVISRSTGARLVLVTDGARLYSAAADALVPAMDAFDVFPRRVLLTPVGPANWGAREAAFERAGFVVMPLTPDGLAKVAAWLLNPEDEPPAIAVNLVYSGVDLAHEINRTADRYMRQALPPPQTIAVLLGDLKSWLGMPTFYLLAATAAQPQFDLELTIRLTYAFRAGGYRVDESSLGRLMRLPWMRRGAMPDWLRAELLRELPPEVRTLVRSAYLGFYSELPLQTGPLDPLDESRMATAVTLRLVEGNVAQDPLLVAFLERGSSALFRALVNWSPLALAVIAGAVAAWQSAAIVGALAVPVEALRGLLPAGPSVIHVMSPAVIGVALYGVWGAHGGAMLGLEATGRFVRMAGFAGVANSARAAASVRFVAVVYAGAGLLGALLASSTLPAAWGGALVTLGFAALIAAASPFIEMLGKAELRLPALLDTPPPFWGYARAGSFVLLFVLLAAPKRSLVSDMLGSRGDTTLWLAIEMPALLSAAIFAAVAARCARLQGVLSANAAVAFAVLFVASHSVAGVVVSPSAIGFVFGMDPLEIVQGPWQPTIAEVRLLLTLLLAWLLAARRLPILDFWRHRDIFTNVAGAIIALGAAISAIGRFLFSAGLPSSAVWLLFAAMPLRLLLIRRESAGTPTREWLHFVVLAKAPGLLLAAAAMIAGLTGLLPVKSFISPAGLNLAGIVLILPEWLLLLPFLRAERAERAPDYRLWASALLLLPCTISLGYALDFQLASWPISLWLGHRFGAATLGPIAIMLSPMLLSFMTGAHSFIFIGSPASMGVFVSALLLARLGASAEFRRKTFSSRDLLAWQLAALLMVFPLRIRFPIYNLGMYPIYNLGMYEAILVIFILLGFSRIRLARLFAWYAVAVSCGTGIAGLFGYSSILAYDAGGPEDLITGAFFLFGARWLAG